RLLRRPAFTSIFPTRRSSDLAAETDRRGLFAAGNALAAQCGRTLAGRCAAVTDRDGGQATGLAQRAHGRGVEAARQAPVAHGDGDRKSTRLNSSHVKISYAVF